VKTLNATQPYTILRGTVGSTVHGLHLEGADDRDEMAVAVEPPEFLIGLARAKFDFDSGFQQGYEHQVERTKKEGEKSGPGDLDRTTYSLRKWMRLACDGNPTVLMLMFVPYDDCDVLTERGAQLREMHGRIISKQCGPKYLGYLNSQKMRLLGLKGQKNVKRPELEEAFGFDTKYAMHVLRLAIQGIEIMETGRLTLPMARDARTLVRSVREGKLSKGEALDAIEHYEQELVAAVAKCKLPDHPDWPFVNRWLVGTYRETWGW
jgi:predicted nucleotidyltransferase